MTGADIERVREDVERVVAEVLAGHRDHGTTSITEECGDDEHIVGAWAWCYCGGIEGIDWMKDGPKWSGPHKSQQADADLRGHLATVVADRLAPLIEQARREGAAEAWDAALTHVWELSDPVSTIDHAEDPSVCTVNDMRQARRENPYRAERVAQTGQEATSVALRGLGATNGAEADSRGSGPENGSGGRDV